MIRNPFLFAIGLLFATALCAGPLTINDREYFESRGLNVTVFADYYPDGHQTGVTVIQHGRRVAANGDLRLEPSPGQWSPVPAAGERLVDRRHGRISQHMFYPDDSKNRKGFNPIEYPDLELAYTVHVDAGKNNSFVITVDLEEPLPEAWVGRVGFNFELFPGHLFGKSWLLDDSNGTFPLQPNGPMIVQPDGGLSAPLAAGHDLTVAPDDELLRMNIISDSGQLELWDGRSNHNNGWYIVRTPVAAGATHNAVRWTVTPHTVEGWLYRPVLQLSQLGYAPAQTKRLVIEQDRQDPQGGEVTVYRLGDNGRVAVTSGAAVPWTGDFLRYRYLTFDFSGVRVPGMYVLEYRGLRSHAFKIDQDVFSRHAWQPTLEYYLPVQMCHMRVNEKYRVWHGDDHADDALMAPVDLNHFDGYLQGPSTLTRFKSLQPVPGLDAGGWHDAGDYDLRVESQIGTIWLLAKMVTEFGLEYDATTIDQQRHLVEIHQPDGRDDVIQQIEHGLLSVLGGYRSLGRLYRGIIVPTLRQYVLLGDASVQTDGLIYDPALAANQHDGPRSGRRDDRWVFTEDNPDRELQVAAGLAAAAVALRANNAELAAEALATAGKLFQDAVDRSNSPAAKIAALVELFLATDDPRYRDRLLALQDLIVADVAHTGWSVGQVVERIGDAGFAAALSTAVAQYQVTLRQQAAETPYGVPYRPNIWGAGWDIQRFGVQQYFFHKAWPEHAGADFYINALNFVLGVHPGENNMSFVSGVGAKSARVAYGTNRAEWSFIPGGVISGTALIRPDLPELMEWPYFWQQTEYVMGGGATNYMFLAIAADRLYGGTRD